MLDDDIKEEDVDLDDLIIPIPSDSNETEIFQDLRPKSNNNEHEKTVTSFTFVSKTDVDLDYLNLDIIAKENSNQDATFDFKHSSEDGDIETLAKQNNLFGCNICKYMTISIMI